jgi:predicted acylesterase/phospholipase RssA
VNQTILDEVTKLSLNTNFADLFAFPGLFITQASLLELKTDKFSKWIDNLKLPYCDNLYINCVNSQADKEEIYTLEDFKKYGYGELVSRSASIPGFISHGSYLDGGVSAGSNPPLDQWLNSDKSIFSIQLMMPYRTTPKNRIEKIFYAFDFMAFHSYILTKDKFGAKLKTFYPDINDVSSTDFGISKSAKEAMIARAYHVTLQQLEFYGIDKNTAKDKIHLALSGGGIRSVAHIGVVKALVEYGYQFDSYSGTSGGSLMAVLLAGYEKKLS